MRARTFSGGSPAALERKLNAWLAENPDITIVTATQSSHLARAAATSDASLQIILTVFYSEPDDVTTIEFEDDFAIGPDL